MDLNSELLSENSLPIKLNSIAAKCKQLLEDTSAFANEVADVRDLVFIFTPLNAALEVFLSESELYSARLADEKAAAFSAITKTEDSDADDVASATSDCVDQPLAKLRIKLQAPKRHDAKTLASLRSRARQKKRRAKLATKRPTRKRPIRDEAAPRQMFRCSICGAQMTSRRSRDKHLMGHVPENDGVCKRCGIFKTTSAALLQIHVRACRKVFQCAVCGAFRKNKKSLKMHMLCHRDPAHECTLCGARVKTRKSLSKHMEAHNAERHLVCEKCGYRTWSSWLLTCHMKIHLEVKPFVCEFPGCPAAFKLPKYLKDHVKLVHKTLEASYFCDQCDRRFISAHDHKRHMSWHRGERPYSCHVCPEVFKTQQHIKFHLRKFHGIEVRRRKILPSVTPQAATVVEPPRPRPFACHICGRPFSRKYDLKLHVLKLHPDAKDSLTAADLPTPAACRSYVGRKRKQQHTFNQYTAPARAKAEASAASVVIQTTDLALPNETAASSSTSVPVSTNQNSVPVSAANQKSVPVTSEPIVANEIQLLAPPDELTFYNSVNVDALDYQYQPFLPQLWQSISHN